jgi:hypothetical protein
MRTRSAHCHRHTHPQALAERLAPVHAAHRVARVIWVPKLDEPKRWQAGGDGGLQANACDLAKLVEEVIKLLRECVRCVH